MLAACDTPGRLFGGGKGEGKKEKREGCLNRTNLVGKSSRKGTNGSGKGG